MKIFQRQNTDLSVSWKDTRYNFKNTKERFICTYRNEALF